MIRALAIFGCVSLGLTTLSCSSCQSDRSTPQGTSAVASASAAPSTPSSASPGTAPTSWPVPVGPGLAILPGKGVGSIRFGATIATIERLMEFPCEIKTDTLCGYNGRAIDFVLSNGVASEMHIHRVDRADAHLAHAKYGVFNGRLLNGVSPGMLRPAAVEMLGAPQRVEPVADGEPWGTIERHHYADMTIEYDKMPSGDIVVGGIVLTAPTASSPNAPSASAATSASANKPK